MDTVIVSNQNCTVVSQQVQHIVRAHLLTTKIILVELGYLPRFVCVSPMTTKSIKNWLLYRPCAVHNSHC